MNGTFGNILRRHLLNHLLSGAMLLAALVFFPGCDRIEQKHAAPTETTTLAYAANYLSILAELALAKGYFRQEGLEVNTRLHAYGKPAMDDMLAGNAEFATVAETPAMFAILDGADLVIVATILKDTDNHAVVARKDRGIVTPEDLRGRRIATTFATSADFFLDSFLAVNGISRQDIQLVELPQDKIAQALLQGEVEAAAIFEPYLNEASRELGEKGAVFFNRSIYTNTFNLVSTRAVVRQNPGKVDKVVRALARAEDFFRRNPAEGVQIAADFNQQSLAATREMLAGASKELSLDQSLILTLEDEARWAINTGRTHAVKIPNFLKHIYPDGLRSAKPDGVRILE